MKAIFLALVVTMLVCDVYSQTDRPAPKPPNRPASTPTPRSPLKYVPPKNIANATRVDGDGGTRAGGQKMPSLYVLAPNHTALTTRRQPSLFWFQTDPAPSRFELTLIEPKNPKPLLKVAAEKADQAGIHRIRLAKHGVELRPGVVYKWTVALVADPANRSQDIIASGTIQRIEPPPQLSVELAAAGPAEAAAVYASHGIWYDALEALSDRVDRAPQEKGVRSQRAMLLNQVGLKDAARSDRQ